MNLGISDLVKELGTYLREIMWEFNLESGYDRSYIL